MRVLRALDDDTSATLTTVDGNPMRGSHFRDLDVRDRGFWGGVQKDWCKWQDGVHGARRRLVSMSLFERGKALESMV